MEKQVCIQIIELDSEIEWLMAELRKSDAAQREPIKTALEALKQQKIDLYEQQAVKNKNNIN